MHIYTSLELVMLRIQYLNFSEIFYSRDLVTISPSFHPHVVGGRIVCSGRKESSHFMPFSLQQHKIFHGNFCMKAFKY